MLIMNENNILSTNEEEEITNEYEILLRQLEAEIRNHIKIQHQMKLQNENLQVRIDELIIGEEKFNEKYQKMKVKINEYNKKIIEDLKNTIKGLNEKNEKLVIDFENKIQILTLNSEKEIRNLEDKYNENTKELKKKLFEYEENKKKLSPTSRSVIFEKKIMNRNKSALSLANNNNANQQKQNNVKKENAINQNIDLRDSNDLVNYNSNILSNTTSQRQGKQGFLNNDNNKNTYRPQTGDKTSNKKKGLHHSSSQINLGDNKKNIMQKISNNNFNKNEINLKKLIYSKATKIIK